MSDLIIRDLQSMLMKVFDETGKEVGLVTSFNLDTHNDYTELREVGNYNTYTIPNRRTIELNLKIILNELPTSATLDKTGTKIVYRKLKL